MRPPGSNYKNYCSSKLLMSCDVLPTCEEGLGVEKKPATQMRRRGREPRGPRCSLTQAGKDQCTQTTKANKKKDWGHTTGGHSCSRGNRIKIRAFFSPKVSIFSESVLLRAGVTEGHSAAAWERTELLIKAGKWFQTRAARSLQVRGLDSDRWGAGSAWLFRNQLRSMAPALMPAHWMVLQAPGGSSSSQGSELARMFALLFITWS